MDCSNCIGLLFGSFDPLHEGHLMMARYAHVEKGLSEIWLVVTPLSPGKRHRVLTSAVIRLENVRQAIQNYQYFKTIDIEFRLPQPNYTIDTIQALKRDFPEVKFVLMIGSDQWLNFSKWHKSSEIKELLEIWIFPRKGYEVEVPIPQGVKLLTSPVVPVSSTQIREINK